MPFIFMGNNEKKLNNIHPWWKPGVKIFSQVSVWIVVPIVLALIIGKKLDAHFDTQPLIFLSLALFGFLFSSFGIFKIVVRYVEKIENISPDVKLGSRPESIGNEENKED